MTEKLASSGTASLARQLAQELMTGPASVAPVLRVVRGPAAAPCVMPPAPCTVHIGRSEAATWRLDDASVSREQCIIERDEAGCFLRDASRRGTQVGGVVITDRVGPLVSGQTISFGNVVLVYEEAAASASASSQTASLAAGSTTVVPRHRPPVVAPRTPMWWWLALLATLAALAWVLLS